MGQLYIGLMSGTSLDGVDGVLVEFGVASSTGLKVWAHRHEAFEAQLAGELLALNSPGENELHRAALAGNALTATCVRVVEGLLGHSGITADRVRAIGAHGQTVRHRPGEFDDVGYSIQLNAPALLAERTGLPVVADFRNRDLAAGGQGAPLVPAFHRAVFGRAGEASAVLNIGGFSNLTALHPDGSVRGFDTGPGNALLDHWCRLQTGRPFDQGGQWAATGAVIPDLLASMLDEPFFALPPPKSTGRDKFNPAWLEASMLRLPPSQSPRAEDVQCTLTELTAQTCAAAVRRHGQGTKELLVCGGGALNDFLLRRLSAALPGLAVVATDDRGLPCTQVEACAFAWLAHAHVEHRCASLAEVTGARGPRILGAYYPAG